jgi:dienelactone hydrolase
MRRALIPSAFAGLLAFGAAMAATMPDLPPFTPGRSLVQFKESAPHSHALEVKLRFSAKEDPPPYDVAQEKFTLLVPQTYRHEAGWGLLVWISAGDAPTIPAAWEPVLARHKLLFVGAHKSGNPRNIFDRFRLALDAQRNLRARFRIEPRRVYVSGFSGGGRVASMLAVSYADLFAGAAPFMGVNFYQDVKADDGKTYGLNYLPDDEILGIARKQGHYVLVTGEKDFNRANTKAVHAAFVRERFAHAHYLEVPKLGHALPDADGLERTLRALDGRPER